MAALDPNFKLAYAEAKWDSKYFEAGLTQLKQVVCMHRLSLVPYLIHSFMQFDSYHVVEEMEESEKDPEPCE
jgi:hypothetical protein